jgi:hypothetical protein
MTIRSYPNKPTGFVWKTKLLLKKQELTYLARYEILSDVARVCCSPDFASGDMMSAIPLHELSELAFAWTSSVPSSETRTRAAFHSGVSIHLWTVENGVLRILRALILLVVPQRTVFRHHPIQLCVWSTICRHNTMIPSLHQWLLQMHCILAFC